MYKVIPPVTHLEYKQRKFLLTESPLDRNIDTYIAVLKREKCRYLVRACEPLYRCTPEQFLRHGITVVDLPFDDGSYPSSELIDQWLELLKLTAQGKAEVERKIENKGRKKGKGKSREKGNREKREEIGQEERRKERTKRKRTRKRKRQK